MSFYRFNDTVTLYTPVDEDYERHVITAAKVQLLDCAEPGKTRVTVYIPLFGRRALKYKPPSKRAGYDANSFTVKSNQKIYIGESRESYPPQSAYTVQQVETHLSGSHHAQHVKLVAYNIPPKEENTDE